MNRLFIDFFKQIERISLWAFGTIWGFLGEILEGRLGQNPWSKPLRGSQRDYFKVSLFKDQGVLMSPPLKKTTVSVVAPRNSTRATETTKTSPGLAPPLPTLFMLEVCLSVSLILPSSVFSCLSTHQAFQNSIPPLGHTGTEARCPLLPCHLNC